LHKPYFLSRSATSDGFQLQEFLSLSQQTLVTNCDRPIADDYASAWKVSITVATAFYIGSGKRK